MKLAFCTAALLVLTSVTICYAENEKPCSSDKNASGKQLCKTSEKLIPAKIIKSKILVEEKNPAAHSNQSIKTPHAADTFNSIIAPLLQAITPHFYDQIIKKDDKLSSHS